MSQVPIHLSVLLFVFLFSFAENTRLYLLSWVSCASKQQACWHLVAGHQGSSSLDVFKYSDQNTDVVKSEIWMCTFYSSWLSWDVSHDMRSRAESAMWESLLPSLYASLLLVSVSESCAQPLNTQSSVLKQENINT